MAMETLLKPLQKIVFQRTVDLETLSAAGRSIFVVGKKDALCRVAQQLSGVLSTPLLPKQAEALSPGYWGTTVESPWLDKSGEVRKVTLLALPDAASRVMSSARPDVIAKQLHGKIAGQEVLLAVPEAEMLASALAVARCVPPYDVKAEKPKKEEAGTVNVGFVDGKPPPEELLTRLDVAAETIRLTQGLVDMPPNVLDPTLFRDIAVRAVEGIPGVTHTMIRGEELRDRGYGLIWNVGKSAPEAPCLLVLTHRGKDGGSGKKGVAIVGKGITFDTGGAALKSRDGMIGMKRDMGGAAGVFGAFLALVRTGGLPCGRPLHCVLCLAENGIGRDMFRQDDIITGYSGLTVEINNTDAEGRLVLADGVSHVTKHLDCDLVVEMATLTNAQCITTGILHGLILATDEELEREAIAAGKLSGDMVHPGLFAPEILMHEYDSKFADMKNSVKNRGNAQSSCAGLFVYKHLMQSGYTGRWLHVDMSRPAFELLDGFATGYGVGLISTLLSNLPP